MKIMPPNYTQSPNLFFDQIFKTLKEGELRVILAILRQTFGWHKSYDRISLSQLAEMTGMERKSACRSLNSLIAKNLVIKKKFGSKGKERCYYSLVMEVPETQPVSDDDGIESEEEMEIVSNNSYQCPKDTTPVSLGHPTQCPKDTTPSVPRTPTKDTETKEKTNSLSVARAVAPAAETRKDVCPPKKEKGHEQDESLPPKAMILQRDGSRLEVTQPQMYTQVTKSHCDFSADAIRYAWMSLCNYEGVVHDWWRFFEGTAKNYNAKKKSKNIGKTCQNKQQQRNRETSLSNPSSADSSARDLSEPILQPLGSLVGFQTLFPRSSDAPPPPISAEDVRKKFRGYQATQTPSLSSSDPQEPEKPTFAAPF